MKRAIAPGTGMRHGSWRRPAIALLALIGLHAQALAEKRPRVPPGKWAVEYAKEFCVLSREGAHGEPGVAFRTRPLTEEQDLLVYLPRTGEPELSEKGQVIVRDSDVAAERWVWVENPSGQRFRHIRTFIDSGQMAEAAKAGHLRVRVLGKLDLAVPLPNVAKALDALRQCEEDLARRWGVDPTEMRAWARPAKALTDMRSLFWNDKDWTAVAMIQSGATRAVLDIDATGALVGCKIVQRSRVAWVDRQFCDTIRKGATFEPALDANGKPVEGKVVTPAIASVRLR